MTIKGARELDHAPIVTSFGRSRSSKQVETYIAFKVEGSQPARSHPSKTDRWMEDIEITMDKANEVEIAVYDKQASEQNPQLIGLLWIKIPDLVEAQRRQKVMMESGAGGWVTAGAMNGDGAGFPGHPGGAGGGMDAPIAFGDPRMPRPGGPVPGGGQSEGIDAWFSVEPAGALALRLNFSERYRFELAMCSDGMHHSQGECTETSARRSGRSWSSRRSAQTQGGGARDERPQVHSAPVLHHHPMRFLQRLPA